MTREELVKHQMDEKRWQYTYAYEKLGKDRFRRRVKDNQNPGSPF